MTDKKKNGGAWKKLAGHIKKVAPYLGKAGDLIGGPGGMALEAIAKLVAGSSGDADRDDVAAKIMANPDLMVRMEELAIQREGQLLDNETKRIETVNATMQVEAQATDAWTRRWRPYWGFVAGTCWGALALSMVTAILAVACFGVDPEILTSIGDSFAAMPVFWGVAMAVLGISAWTRGKEKVETIRAEAAKK